jgi:hypothetical protein
LAAPRVKVGKKDCLEIWFKKCRTFSPTPELPRERKLYLYMQKGKFLSPTPTEDLKIRF